MAHRQKSSDRGRNEPELSVEKLRDRLTSYMDTHGLRSTAQRRLVTETFFRSTEHLSIEDLLRRVRAEEPSVGYATVYRTLKLLVESGLAYERHFGDGVSRYEVAHEDEHHDHLICTACDRIIEFEEPEIERIQDRLARKHGFVLAGHRHELFGVCREGPEHCPHFRARS